MSPGRLRAVRAELVSTVVVLALVVVGVFALWPRGADRAPSATMAGPTTTTTATDVDLAAVRNRAALAPCPAPVDPQATATGPLAGIRLPCLGAPGTVDLGAALAGRPTLLNVWASWCAPCRAELPALAAYAARPDAIAVLGVDVRDDPAAALTLLADLGIRLPSVTDPDGVLRAPLALPPALPISYLVRADGSVAAVDPPVPFTTADEVAAAVARLGAAG